MNIPIFDPTKPVDSIIQFTNRHLLLPDDMKREFISGLEELFSNLSYGNKKVPFDQAFIERFSKYDIPNLYEVMDQLKVAAQTGRFLRVVANLSKTTKSKFSPREVPGCCQIRTTKHGFWGWIPMRYVEASEKLKAVFNEDRKTLEFEELSPSVLYGLHRLALTDSSSESIEFPLQAYLELIEFAVPMECEPLIFDLLLLAEAMLNDEKNKKEIETLEASDPENKYLAAITKMCEFNELRKAEFNEKKILKPVVHHSEATHHSRKADGSESGESVGSRWFDVKAPYKSIMRFTARCSSLSMEEQNRFLSAVRRFFTIQAYHNTPVPIPQSLIGRVTEIDLPFLLKKMELVKKHEKKRVIACMQIVTQVQLSPDIHVSTNTYGTDKTPRPERVGWVKSPPSSSGAASSSSTSVVPYTVVPIRTEEFFDYLGNIANRSLKTASPKELFQLLQLAVDGTTPEIKNSVLKQIKSICRNEENRQAMVDLIAPLLEEDVWKEVCDKINLYPLYPTNIAEFPEDQLYTLFRYNLGRAGDVEPLIERHLNNSLYRFAILQKAIDNLDTDRSRQITSYCYRKAMSFIQNTRRSYQPRPQSSFVQAVQQTVEQNNRSGSSYYGTDEYLDGQIKHQMKMCDVEQSDLPAIYTAMERDEAIIWWEMANLKEVRETIVTGLTRAHPDLLAKSQTKACMKAFFPDLIGNNSNFEKILVFMFKEAAAEESNYQLQSQRARQYPISDADVLKYNEILDSDEFKEWFSANVPNIKKHFNFWWILYHNYNVEQLKAPFKILEEFQQEHTEAEAAYQLLRDLFLKREDLSKPKTFISIVRKTGQLQENAALLAKFFESHPDIFNQSDKLKEIGATVVHAVEKLSESSVHVVKLKSLLESSKLDERHRGFFCDLFTAVFYKEEALDWHGVYNIEEFHGGSSRIVIERVFNQMDDETLTDWLESIDPDLKAHIVTSLCNREKKLPHMQKLKELRSETEDKKWLENEDHVTFIINLLASLFGKDDDKSRQQAVSRAVKNKSFDAVDIQNLKRYLEKDEVKALLSTDELSKARVYLVNNLRSSASSSSSSSTSSTDDGGCIIA